MCRVLLLRVPGSEGYRDGRCLHDLIATIGSDRCQYVFLAVAFMIVSQGTVMRVHVMAQVVANVCSAPLVGPVAVRMRVSAVKLPQQRPEGRY